MRGEGQFLGVQNCVVCAMMWDEREIEVNKGIEMVLLPSRRTRGEV